MSVARTTAVAAAIGSLACFAAPSAFAGGGNSKAAKPQAAQPAAAAQKQQDAKKPSPNEIVLSPADQKGAGK